MDKEKKKKVEKLVKTIEEFGESFLHGKGPAGGQAGGRSPW